MFLLYKHMVGAKARRLSILYRIDLSPRAQICILENHLRFAVTECP